MDLKELLKARDANEKQPFENLIYTSKSKKIRIMGLSKTYYAL